FDLRRGRQWDGWPPGTTNLVFDATLEHYARSDTEGNASVRRVADDVELARIPAVRKDIDVRGGSSPEGGSSVLYGTAAGPMITRGVEWRSGQTVFAQEAVSTRGQEGSGWVHWLPDSRRFILYHHAPPCLGYRVYDAATGKATVHVKEGGPYYQLHVHPHGK